MKGLEKSIGDTIRKLNRPPSKGKRYKPKKGHPRLYSVSYDILKAAAMIDTLPKDAKVPWWMICRIYTGNAISKLDEPHNWGITITTTAEDSEGAIHTFECGYRSFEPMLLSQFVNGIKHQWLAVCDEELPDMDCISALALARFRA